MSIKETICETTDVLLKIDYPLERGFRVYQVKEDSYWWKRCYKKETYRRLDNVMMGLDNDKLYKTQYQHLKENGGDV